MRFMHKFDLFNLKYFCLPLKMVDWLLVGLFNFHTIYRPLYTRDENQFFNANDEDIAFKCVLNLALSVCTSV